MTWTERSKHENNPCARYPVTPEADYYTFTWQVEVARELIDIIKNMNAIYPKVIAAHNAYVTQKGSMVAGDKETFRLRNKWAQLQNRFERWGDDAERLCNSYNMPYDNIGMLFTYLEEHPEI